MFEMMLMGGGSQGVMYPDSGPGVKYLKYGDPTVGFFGEVPDNLLFTIPELRDQLDFWSGLDTNPNTNMWLKIYLDNKVLYIPKRAVTTEVTWDQLYNAGLIYGTNDNGPYTTPTPTNQYRIVAAPDKRLLKVRALTTNTPPLALPNTTLWNHAATAGSEWGRIVAALMTDIGTLPATTPRFRRYVAADQVMVPSGLAIGQTPQGGAGYSVNASNTAVLGQVTTAPNQWLPVLELLPTDTSIILPMSKFVAASDTFAAPVTMEPVGYYNPILQYKGVQSATLSQRQVFMTDPVTTNPVYSIGRTSIRATMNPATWVATTVSYEE